MNDYFAITKEGVSPRIVSLVIDKAAQELLNEEFKKAQTLFFNEEVTETKKEDGKKIKTTTLIPLTEEIYSPGYETDSAILKIENFDVGLKIFETFDNPTNVTKFDITKINLEDIIAIFTFDYETNKCFIQSYNSSKFIKMGKTIFWLESKKEMTTSENIKGLEIDNKLVATLHRKSNNNIDFLFRNFNNAKRIFKNLSVYFEAATNPILKKFITTHFETTSDFDITEIANKETRKYVTIINIHNVLKNETITIDDTGKEIRNYTDKTAEDICELAKKFDVDLPLNTTQTKVVLPQNTTELNELLSGFASLIYHSPVTGIRMKASSAKPYPKK